MIDDQVEFAVKPHRAVHSLGYYAFSEKFVPSLNPGKYQAPGKTEWRLERNKALIWLALVDQALQESKTTGTSFSERAATSGKGTSFSKAVVARINSRVIIGSTK